MFIESFPNKDYRFEFYVNYGKKTHQAIKKETGCYALVNLWYYDMTKYAAAKTDQAVLDSTDCDVVLNGKPVKPLKYVEYGLCINDSGELSVSTADKQKNYAIGCPPQYIDGKKYPSNTYFAKNGCTYVGFKADGTPVLMLVSRDEGKTSAEAESILLSYGCVNILRYDGSWSSQGDLGNGKVCTPSQTRIVQSYLLVYKRNQSTKPVEDIRPVENTSPTENTNYVLKIGQPSYNWAYNPGIRVRTTHLVLHHVGAKGNFTPQQIHNIHLGNKWAGIAYHFYVRKDGTIYRGRNENWNGGHTLNYNNVALGICFEGNFEEEMMPEIQKIAGRALVADIKKRYSGIIVKRHKDLNSTACPGKNFDFNYITSGTLTSPTPAQPVNPVTPTPTTNRDYVKKFQTWMNTNYNMGLVVDGIYGVNTKLSAVKVYQRYLNTVFKAGLIVDGIWGAKTKNATRNVKQDDSGLVVYILQGLLYCYGFDANGFDGIFGRGMLAAVQSFQKSKKLDADGIIGKNTFEAMMK